MAPDYRRRPSLGQRCSRVLSERRTTSLRMQHTTFGRPSRTRVACLATRKRRGTRPADGPRRGRAASSKQGVAERRRLERNLHDGAPAALVTLAVATCESPRTRLREDPAAAGCNAQRRRRRGLKLSRLEELREARAVSSSGRSSPTADLETGASTHSRTAPRSRSEIVAFRPLRLDEGVEAAVYYLVAEKSDQRGQARPTRSRCAGSRFSTNNEEFVVEIQRQRKAAAASMGRAALGSRGPRRPHRGLSAVRLDLKICSPRGPEPSVPKRTLPIPLTRSHDLTRRRTGFAQQVWAATPKAARASLIFRPTVECEA